MTTCILLIEDDDGQRRLFSTALEQAGYTVFEAPNGREGLRLYREHSCDLVITDIFMPHEDGIEVMFELKRQHPGVKVIAITGGGSWSQHGRVLNAEDSLEIARGFGALRTFKKPIKVQELLETVEELRSLEPPGPAQTTDHSLRTAPTKRLLLIEDDEAQRSLFTTSLQRAGYEVSAVSDGRAGIELYQEQDYDLVITDIFMPEEDGIETIFELRAHNPLVKIVAISGGGRWDQYGSQFGADDPLEIAKNFGAARTLKKPVKIRQLLAIVDELLEVQGRLYAG